MSELRVRNRHPSIPVPPGQSVFDPAYRDRLRPRLERLEKKRRDLIRQIVFGLPFSVGAGIVVALILAVATGWHVFAVLSGIVFAIGCSVYFCWPLVELCFGVSRYLVAEIAASLGLRYAYDDFSPPGFEQFELLALVPDRDTARFRNLLEGEWHGLAFSVYEAVLEDRHQPRNSLITAARVFRGQLFRITCPRRFGGKTILARDLGWLNGFAWRGPGMSRAGMVDNRFERAFEVWTSDQLEARYLLDPLVLERFIELDRQFGGKKLRAAFHEQQIFIVIEGSKMLPDLPLTGSFDEYSAIEPFLDEMAAIFELIDSLLDPLGGRRGGDRPTRDTDDTGERR